MVSYGAFLRGVNIGGKSMKMPEACDVLRAAGLRHVSSVLATGNILFESDRPQGELRVFLEHVLSDHYKDDVNLFVKNTDEVSRYVSSVPFEKTADHHIYAFICEEGFEEVLLEEFRKITPSAGEAAEISNVLFYWQCRKGATLDSGFSKILGRKHLKDKFTSRNVDTMAKVLVKLQAME